MSNYNQVEIITNSESTSRKFAYQCKCGKIYESVNQAELCCSKLTSLSETKQLNLFEKI